MIRLAYERAGHEYNGTIWVQIWPTRGFMPEEEFEGYTFSRMMSRLASVLRKYEQCDHLVLERKEIEDSSYEMSPTEVQQLREDPAAAISSMQVPDRTVVVRDPEKLVCYPKDEPVMQSLLRAGHDTMADAFGYYTYFRLRDGKIECPYDGRWKEYSVVTAFGTPGVFYKGLDSDEPGALWFSPDIVDENWSRTFTKTLLDVWEKKGLSRYFLPRRWNKSGPWISHEELKQKYETYLKEKEDATDRAASGSDTP
jgi:hypothetical protein